MSSGCRVDGLTRSEPRRRWQGGLRRAGVGPALAAIFAAYALGSTFGVPCWASGQAFLNAWVEERGFVRFDPVRALEPNKDYQLVVDVSLVPYRHPEAAVLSRAFQLFGHYQGLDSAVWTVRLVGDGETTAHLRAPRGSWDRERQMKVDLGLFAEWNRRLDKAPGPFSLGRVVFPFRTLHLGEEPPLAVVLMDGYSFLAGLSMRVCIDFDFQCYTFGTRHSEHFFEYELGPPPPLLKSSEPRWNSWVTRASPEEPVERLTVSSGALDFYTLNFDLSLFDYALELGLPGYSAPGAPLDPMFADRLDELRKPGAKPPRLRAWAMALGESIEIVRGRQQEVDVDLDRLDAAAPLQPDASSIESLSRSTGAARLELRLKARERGCAGIAVSITDESGYPLDHLVRTLRVVDQRGEGPDCGAGSAASLAAGLETLLSVAGPTRAAAALHVFEFELENKPKSVGFYLQADGTQHAWELAEPLSLFLGDPGNLEARLRSARDQAKKNVEDAYAAAAHELAGALFSPRGTENRAQAAAALNKLQTLAAGSGEPPVVIARLVDNHNDVLMVPLGLLSAGGSRRVLPKPIRPVIPLRRVNFGAAGCIASWKLAIPETLADTSLAVPKEVRSDPAWLGDELQSLRDYWTQASVVPSEGLVLAAHHDSGRIWYLKDDPRLQANLIARSYERGGASVLAVCRAGAVTREDSFLVGHLNELGVETMIVSPFSLPADYGKALAIEFAVAAQRALAAKERTTVQTLFERAVQKAPQRLQSHPATNVAVGEIGYELVLAGNHELQLCPR